MKSTQILTSLVAVGFCILVLIGIRHVSHQTNRAQTSTLSPKQRQQVPV